jgi:hypothetical protein
MREAASSSLIIRVVGLRDTFEAGRVADRIVTEVVGEAAVARRAFLSDLIFRVVGVTGCTVEPGCAGNACRNRGAITRTVISEIAEIRDGVSADLIQQTRNLAQCVIGVGLSLR